MPPWFIDRTVGIQRFKDDPSLTDREIETIVNWVDTGAPKGNPADLPAPVDFGDPDAWNIGKPDLIVMGVEHTIKPADSDWWGNYTVDSGLTEDRYIKAVETKPGPGPLSKQVTHHAVTNLANSEDFDVRDIEANPIPGQLGLEDDEQGLNFLNEYGVGKNGDIFPDGSARLMKKGAKLVMNMHYHSIGVEVKDRPRVGIVFYPKGYVPKYHIISKGNSARNYDLDIPANTDNVRHDGYYLVAKPARLTAYQPHMHNRGKAQCLTAIYPDARVETLSCVKNYQFGWHRVYNYADDVAPLLPAGTILQVTSWHNNTVSNKYNPDPSNWVGDGQRTVDDMSHAWLTYIYLTNDDFKRQVEERKGHANKTNTGGQ
jgi:hypothetical protein